MKSSFRVCLAVVPSARRRLPLSQHAFRSDCGRHREVSPRHSMAAGLARSALRVTLAVRIISHALARCAYGLATLKSSTLTTESRLRGR